MRVEIQRLIGHVPKIFKRQITESRLNLGRRLLPSLLLLSYLCNAVCRAFPSRLRSKWKHAGAIVFKFMFHLR